MTLALKVSHEITAQIHRLLERIQQHEGLSGYDKKVLTQQLAVALLSVSTIKQVSGNGTNEEHLEELHKVSALVNKFRFFISQLKEKDKAA